MNKSRYEFYQRYFVNFKINSSNFSPSHNKSYFRIKLYPLLECPRAAGCAILVHIFLDEIVIHVHHRRRFYQAQ